MERSRNGEGALEPTDARHGSFVDGVATGTSHSGGVGSATSYAQKKGRNPRPGEEVAPVETRGAFWPKGKRHYTNHHSG